MLFFHMKPIHFGEKNMERVSRIQVQRLHEDRLTLHQTEELAAQAKEWRDTQQWHKSGDNFCYPLVMSK